MKKQIILVSCLIGLNACSPAQQTTNHTEATTMTNKNQCIHLHRVTDIDDLLKQMYDNINSQCLFEMPTSELAKIWGIPVMDFMMTGTPQFQSEQYKQWEDDIERKSTLFIYKIHEHKKIGGKWQKIVSFKIKASPKFYENHLTFGGSLDKGQYPAGLPKPRIRALPTITEQVIEDGFLTPQNTSPKLPINNVYQGNTQYYWVSQHHSAQTPVLLMQTLPLSSLPDSIVLIQNSDVFFQLLTYF